MGDTLTASFAIIDSKGLTHEYAASVDCAPDLVQDSTNERRFVLNGLWHANEILGHEAFTPGDWKVIGEYVYDDQGGRHQAFYSPVRDTVVMDELVRSHERIQVEQSLKYSPTEAGRLWSRAGMTEAAQWKHQNEYGKHGSISFSVQSRLFPNQRSRSG